MDIDNCTAIDVQIAVGLNDPMRIAEIQAAMMNAAEVKANELGIADLSMSTETRTFLSVTQIADDTTDSGPVVTAPEGAEITHPAPGVSRVAL